MSWGSTHVAPDSRRKHKFSTASLLAGRAAHRLIGYVADPPVQRTTIREPNHLLIEESVGRNALDGVIRTWLPRITLRRIGDDVRSIDQTGPAEVQQAGRRVRKQAGALATGRAEAVGAVKKVFDSGAEHHAWPSRPGLREEVPTAFDLPTYQNIQPWSSIGGAAQTVVVRQGQRT